MVKIDKDKPLPEHTKLDYSECYAKIILEDLFADRYGELTIADKPDLQNDYLSIGVEVTSAIPVEHREAVKLWYMMPYYDSDKQTKSKERMKQLGVEYQGGIQAWPNKCYSNNQIEDNPVMEFIKCVETKVNKLNSNNYKELNQYDLFVDSELDTSENLLPKVLERLLTINQKLLKFTYIYLINQDKIIQFDINETQYKLIDYIDKQFFYANQARKMVIHGEENE